MVVISNPILHTASIGGSMGKLTAKQEMFCKEYLIDLNATQAAIRAGYSEKTARKIASENLTKPDIGNRIQELSEDRNKRVEVDADWILQQAIELLAISRGADNLNAAKGFLELAGKHCKINAFKENVELSGHVQVTEITRKII
jgi:phage terminase small subunit